MVRLVFAVCMAAMMLSAGEASACLVPRPYPVTIEFCALADPTRGDVQFGIGGSCGRNSYDVEGCSKLIERRKTIKVTLAVRFHVARAHAYIEHRRDFDRGMRDLDEAFRLGTDSPEAHYLRGVVLAARGEHRPALAAFDIVSFWYSDHPLTRERRALANLKARGDTQEALDLFADAAANFSEAMRLADRDGYLRKYELPTLVMRRGIALIKAGDSEAGEQDIAEAVRTSNPAFVCDQISKRGLRTEAFPDCRWVRN